KAHAYNIAIAQGPARRQVRKQKVTEQRCSSKRKREICDYNRGHVLECGNTSRLSHSAERNRISAVKPINSFFAPFVLLVLAAITAVGQSPSGRNPDVSNTALITKSTPSINDTASKNQSADAAAAALRKMADDYYVWRNEKYPVRSSDAGLHSWDDRLTDY